MANVKPEIRNGIEFHKGNTKILLIAPHGVDEVPYDDIGTADLAKEIQRHLGCSAVINTTYRKPTGKDKKKRNDGKPSFKTKVLNLNLVDQARRHPDFIKTLKGVVEADGLTYAFWIHGIADERITEGIDCFIGYGQPNEGEEERFTADEKAIQNLIKQFGAQGIKAVKSPADSNYRGWKTTYMNQWFRLHYGLDEVQSIQLEFKKTGFRRSEDIQEKAVNIAQAISAFVKPLAPASSKADDAKVEEAYNHLKSIFVKHFQNAMLECGQYLIDTFYSGDYEEAQKKKFTANKSLSKLIKRIQQDAKIRGDAPSRTWIYDAVNIAIDNHLYEQDKLPSVYGQLGHSHKVNLTSAPNNLKSALAQEAHDNKYTVSRLRERIRQAKQNLDVDYISMREPMPVDRLKRMRPEQLQSIKTKTEALVKKVQEKEKLYQGNLALIEQVLEQK